MTGTRQRALPPDRFALLCALAVTAGLFVLGLYLKPYWLGQDGVTYQGAAERLNAGHRLYALMPGDRPMALLPPYWTVPLLSPPFIAVLWRPFALLPFPTAVAGWFVLTFGALLGSLAVILAGPGVTARRRYVAALLVALMSQQIAVQAIAANVDALVLAGIVLVWLAPRRWDPLIGAAIAFMAAVKLVPIIFAWWLVCQGRWRAVRWTVAALVGVGIISLVGAGLGVHLDYLRIATQTNAEGTTPQSLAGIARIFGVPFGVSSVLPIASFVIAAAAMYALRERRGVSFVIAVLAGVFGSPVVNNTNLVRILPVLLPLGYPQPEAGLRLVGPRLRAATTIVTRRLRGRAAPLKGT